MYESLSLVLLLVLQRKKRKKCVSADTHTILQQDKRLAFRIHYTDFQNGTAHTLLSISKYVLHRHKYPPAEGQEGDPSS